MTCSSTSGNRAVLAVAKAVAENRAEAPITRSACEKSFHDLLREGRSLSLRAPDESEVRDWFSEQCFTAQMEIPSERSRNAAVRNLQEAEKTYRDNPGSLSPATFYAWRFTAGHATFAAQRQRPVEPITVAFDCDGVLYQFNDTLREWLAARGWDRDQMPDPTVYSLQDAWGLSNRTLHKEMPMAVKAGILWHKGEPFFDGVDAARRIGLSGHNVIVNTARALPGVEEEAAAATMTWLRSQDLHADHLHLADPFRPEDKLSVPFDVLFDDHPGNVEAALSDGRKAFIVDQPWNAHATHLPRVQYSEIESRVEELASASTRSS